MCPVLCPMGIEAVQAANGLPNLMGVLLQAVAQQSVQLAAQQVALDLSLQLGEAAVPLDDLGETIDLYA